MSQRRDEAPAERPEPPAAGWQRLDPRTLLTAPFTALGRQLLPLAGALVGLGSVGGVGGLVVTALLGVLGVGLLPWLTTTYRVTATHVELRRGLLNRTTVTARLDRVRSVELNATVLHRLLRLTKVAVGTGVDDSRLELDALSVSAAEALRVALLHGAGSATEPGAVGAAVAGTHPPAAADAPGGRVPPPAPAELVRLDWSWARFAPLNLANLTLALAGLGAAASQFEQLVDERRAEGVWAWLRHSDVPLLLGLAVLAALLLWVPLSGVGYAFRWYGLAVTREHGREGPTLRQVHGALTRRATTVEEARLRGAVVRRRLLVGLAGGAELDLLTTGLADNETRLLPSAPAPVVVALATDVLGEQPAVTGPVTSHGGAARRRYLFRHVRTTVLLLAALTVAGRAAEAWWDLRAPAWIGAALLPVTLPVAVGTARLRYRRLGHAVTAGYLVSCTGTLDATRTVLEADGIVGWRVHQSFWDRRRGLAQLTATTAAGGEAVLVPDVPLGEAVAVAAAATPRAVVGFLA